jgi:arylsulfatase A-like enzyme
VPFFLYLALPSPHTPILPTPEWQGKSSINPYADFMMQVDDYVGQVMETVRAQGIEENTIIIFTSDNGCSPQADFEILAEYGHHPGAGFRGHKADIYEGGHRIPFIIKWPLKIASGSVSNATISLTDLMATCADLLNVPLQDNEAEDSFSLVPLFDSKETTSYLREATVHHSINGSFAIRKGNYKLIFASDSGGWSYLIPGKDDVSGLPKYQLYDLAADPSESENIVALYPDIVTELSKQMVSYIENGRSTPGLPQQNSPLQLNGKEWHQVENLMTQ